MADSLEQSAELAWPEFIKTRVLNTITSSRVSDRLDFINHSLLIRLRRKGTLSPYLINIYTYINVLTRDIDLPIEALPSLLHLIFLTYSRYHDRESRRAILEVLKELDNWNAEHFQKTIVPALVKEADKIGKRASTG